MQNLLLLSCAIVAFCGVQAAEERWAWSSRGRNGRGIAADRSGGRRNERLEDFGSDEDERTTPKPQSDDDFAGQNGFGGQNTQRFNFGAFPQGVGSIGPGGPVGGFPGGPGAFPGQFGGQFPGGQQPGFNNVNVGVQQSGGFGGPAQFPQNGFGGPGGFAPPGANGIGPGFYGGAAGRPGLNAGGVLVGPGGPTGIIGRPNGGYPIGGRGGVAGTPGVLVGPGGPTGIVGRPPGYRGGYGFAGADPNAFGYGGGFGGNGIGGPGGYNNIGIGINQQRPGAFPGGPGGFPGGPGGFPGGPGGFPGGPGGFPGGPGGFPILPYSSGSNIAADEPTASDKKNDAQRAEGKSKY